MLPSRRMLAALSAWALLVSACSGGSLFDDTTAPRTTAAPTPPVTTGPRTTADREPTTTATTRSTPPSTSSPLTCCIGTPGIGDELYPGLGNGGYDVEHYAIDLTVDPGNNHLEATATISAVATGDLISFNLDLHGLEVTAVNLDGAAAGFFRDGDELIVAPVAIAAGRDFEVAISYRGTPDPSPSAGIPFPMGWNGHDDSTFVIAEPDGARTWFPANDHPLDKATFSFAIDVPASHAAVANGILVDTEPRGERTVFRWESAHPMATYLATVVVAELERRGGGEAAGVPIRNYFPPRVADELDESFAVTEAVIEFFAETFGPYPFDAYGVVVVGDFPGALETQTISVFGEGVARARFVETIIVHEVAHQWFGDSVSPRRWRDVWLNEGFASYAEWLWAEHDRGRDAYGTLVAGTHSLLELRVHEPPGDPSANDLFSSSVYDRGALTLHALRETVGDTAFFATLRTFTDRFAYGNAGTADFIAVAEEIAERDLDALFDDWLFAGEVPSLP